MTHLPQPTPIATPWDLVSIYAASFGLFAPGALMAARLQAQQTPQPPQGQRP